ncbi:tetratricopeptide repeat protein [Oryzisolibacter sp. LB2S]|uniref:tetratricopeptide repeat protein n=1 Tax=Alicycliphilus soli TaxID=3228789 RepID=UPI003458B358
MLNIKLGLAALGLEVGAWSGAWLLSERSDTALASYLLLHAAASLLLSLALLPLLPSRLSRPRWASVLLMACCSYAVPVAGFLGVLLAFVILRVHRHRPRPEDFDAVQLPEFDQHQRRQGQFRHVGLQSFLANDRVPVQERLRAMAALQFTPGRMASPLLRSALGDASDDLRLLAYGMLDNLEKRVNRAIDDELELLDTAPAHGDQRLRSAQRLSDLYWELVYQELVQGDLRTHAIEESLRYCHQVLAQQPANAAMHLRHGRLLHALGRADEAEQAYDRARALGMPATRGLPYLAQLAFERRDHAQARALMRELGTWGALPRLRPVIDYWTQS